MMMGDSVGALATSLCVATYLSGCDPCTQASAMETCLTPVLEERGIVLCWRQTSPGVFYFDTPETDRPLSQPGEGGLTPSERFGSAVQSPTTSDGSQPTSVSFTTMSSALASQLVGRPFIDQWSAVGLTPTQLLSAATLASSWNKWPLVYDPDSFAEVWLRHCHGDELTVLDAGERLGNFYLSLERLLVGGGVALVRGVGPRLDPALQPIVELGHTWHCSSGRAWPLEAEFSMRGVTSFICSNGVQTSVMCLDHCV